MRRWCGTLSKALEKSRTIMSTCFLSSRCWWSSCVRLINCVSQLLCALNPFWQSARMLLASKWSLNWDTTPCSSNFEQLQVKLTGLYLDALKRSPFLKTGVILACFQSSGTVPVESEAWKIVVKQCERGEAANLRMRAGIRSGPDALFTLSSSSSFSMPSWGVMGVMVALLAGGCWFGLLD